MHISLPPPTNLSSSAKLSSEIREGYADVRARILIRQDHRLFSSLFPFFFHYQGRIAVIDHLIDLFIIIEYERHLTGEMNDQ